MNSAPLYVFFVSGLLGTLVVCRSSCRDMLDFKGMLHSSCFPTIFQVTLASSISVFPRALAFLIAKLIYMYRMTDSLNQGVGRDGR